MKLVFKYDNTKLGENDSIQYQYSLQDKDDSQTYCISTLIAQRLDADKNTILVSGTRNSLKIWNICEDTSKKNLIKHLKMCQTINLNTEAKSSDSESEIEDNEEDIKDEAAETTPPKKSCLIQ